MPATGKPRWFTTRTALTFVCLTIATAMVYSGKMDATAWVYVMTVLVVGRHSTDVIQAIKGK